MKKLTVALFALAAFSGCASQPQWERAGATPEQRRADERECRAAAQYESRQDLWWRDQIQQEGGSATGRDDRFSPVLQRQQFENEYRRRERRLVSECMESRGYEPSRSWF